MTTLGDAAELDAAIGAVDWAALPPGVVRADLDAPSGRLARIVAGAEDAPRVLLVPGATGSKEDFLLMIPSLLAAGYRVESYDLAGQFESGGAGPENLDPPRAHYDYDLFCADLRAVLDAGRAPAHVLGYSFGGLVAQVLLVEQPELFASLALLTSPPDVGQVFRGVKRIGRFSGATSPHAGASLMLWGIRNNLNRVPPERIAFVRERFAQTRRASVDDIVGLMKRMPDVAEAVAALPLPKLVATGSHDLWPEAQYREYAARIGASIAVYDTGHSPCETTPHQLVRDLLSLYGETDQTPRE